jgi:hypothetical protein
MRTSLLFFALAASASNVAAQTATDWRTGPLTAGSWSYRAVADGSEAVFTDARVTPRVVVKCSRPARAVTLTLASAVPGSAITLATTDTQRVVPASYNAQTSQIIAQIAGNDALLDAVAFSRGRFALSVAGGATLVVPAWPEVARSIEDCRI